MAFKITLIVALCIAGAFADETLVKPPAKAPCTRPISESAEEIPHEFEEAMNEMDEIREMVSTATMDAYFHGTDPNVILECFKQERGNYMKLGGRISRMIRNATQELAEELKENFEKYAERAEAPLRNISVTMKTLPQKMWMFIKDKEFGKALEVMRESRMIIEENSKELGEIIRDMAVDFPEAAKKAEEMAHEIRETARTGCKEIAMAFHKCVEEGGPKGPIETDAEIEAELEKMSQETRVKGVDLLRSITVGHVVAKRVPLMSDEERPQ